MKKTFLFVLVVRSLVGRCTFISLLSGCLLWLVPWYTHANTSPIADIIPIAVIDSLDQPVDLASYIQFIEDPARSISFEDIQAGKTENLWQLNTASTFIGKHSKNRYWFRLTLSYSQNVTVLQPLLSIPVHSLLINELSLWIPESDNHYRQVLTGGLHPYVQRDDPSFQYTFHLPTTSGTHTLIGWVDNQNASYPALLPLMLFSAQQQREQQHQVHGVMIAFYAIMSALFLYNACLFLSLRQRHYGFYLLFLLAAIYQCAYVDGMNLRWLWPTQPTLNYRLGRIDSMLVIFFYQIFVWEALDQLQFSRRIHKFYKATFWVSGLALLNTSFTPYLNQASFVVQMYSGLMIPMFIVTLLVAVYKRQHTAGYLLMAEVFTIIGAIGFILMIRDVLPINNITLWALHGGFLGEALFLSLAVAARTNIVIQEKLHAQQLAIMHLENYEALYEDSIEGRFHYSIKTHAAKCNQSMALICGYDSVDEFFQDENILSLLDDETNQEIGELLLERKVIIGREVTITHRKTQRLVYVSVNFELVCDELGKPDHVEGSLIDITERKLKEQVTKEKEVSETQNKAKSQFFASISHELRTPLTAILGYAEIAQQKDLAESKRIAHAIRIERSGKHLLQLINDILDLSKIEAQKLDIELLDVDLFELVRDVDDYFTLLAAKKRIGFKTAFHLPLPQNIKVDPTRLKQVLINLCANSVKFTDKGGVAIDVFYNNADQLLCFTIKDTGIGLKPEQIDKLFGAFMQADSSITRQFGGTGLGLYLSKQLTNKLGGDITVASEYGKGSTFTVSLPLQNSDDIVWLHSVPETELRSNELEIPRLQGRILYAEDNSQNQQLITEIVERTGCTIEIASNGQAALVRATQTDFDLIFTDIRMPVMNGIEFACLLRQIKPAVPVVAISAEVALIPSAELAAAGFQQLLSKPVNTRTLYEILSKFLAAQPQGKVESSNAIHPLRVLLVEDNPVNQQLVAFHLSQQGATVILADDGGDAIVKARLEAPDLILIDMEMPHMDGMTAVRYLRSKGFAKPIYALTANASDEAVQQCKDAGCDGYFAKPLETAKLKELIQRLAI